MTFHERSAAVTIGALLLTFGLYFILLTTVVDRRVDHIAYKPLLALTVVVLIVVMATSHVFLALLTPNQANNLDERDRSISQRADQVGGLLLGVATLGAIGLAIFEVAHIYIANGLLIGLIIAQLAAESTKLWLYRQTS